MNIEDNEQVKDFTNCTNCNDPVQNTDVFCSSCGFPMNGSEEEKANFNYKTGYKELQLQDNQKGIRKGTNSLYVVAAVLAVYGFVYFLVEKKREVALNILINSLSLAVIFLLLAFWSIKKPIAALISGLTLFSALQLLILIQEPANIFKGIILKIFVFVYLIKGLQSAFEAQKINKEIKVK